MYLQPTATFVNYLYTYYENDTIIYVVRCTTCYF